MEFALDDEGVDELDDGVLIVVGVEGLEFTEGLEESLAVERDLF